MPDYQLAAIFGMIWLVGGMTKTGVHPLYFIGVAVAFAIGAAVMRVIG